MECYIYRWRRNTKNNLKYKKQITDTVIKISDEHQIIIEMNQFKNEKNVFEKNTSYAYPKILGGTKIGSKIASIFFA